MKRTLATVAIATMLAVGCSAGADAPSPDCGALRAELAERKQYAEDFGYADWNEARQRRYDAGTADVLVNIEDGGC